MSSSTASLKIIVTCVGGGALTFMLTRKIAEVIRSRNLRRRFEEKCKEWPKDTVILHGIRRGKLCPNPSPFVLKLETFLRLHKIPYIFDCEFPKGVKQKMPWITLNGEHYTDSQLIIEFLSEKYKTKKDAHADARLQGAATMARIMMDEHFFWGLILWRYVYSNSLESLSKIFNMSPSDLKAFQKMTYGKYKEVTWFQGVGRHSQQEVTKIMCDDLRALSQLLGKNEFLLGSEPGDDDCAVFGMVAQLIWNDVESPYTKLIEEELPNLKEYCFRIKGTYI